MRLLKEKNGESIFNTFYIGVLYALITVALNSDLSSSRILWWGVVLLFVATSSYLQMKKYRDFKFDKTYLIWSGLFFGICIASIFWAQSTSFAMGAIKSMLIHFVIFVLLLSSIKNTNDIKILLAIVLAASLTNAIYLMLQNPDILIGGTEIGASRLGDSDGWNSNSIGMMTAVSSLIGLSFYGKTKNRVNRLAVIAAIVFLVFVSFVTGSRKAVIIVMIGIMLYIPMKARKRKITAFVFAVFVAIMAFYLIMNIPYFYNIVGWRIDAFLSQYTGSGSLDGSAEHRKILISSAIDTWEQYPILGCGMNCFRIFGEIATGREYYAHNNYVEILADLGIVGFISYYWGFAYLLVKLWKLRNSEDVSKILLVIILIILIMGYACVHYNDFLFEILIMLAFSHINLSQKTYKT